MCVCLCAEYDSLTRLGVEDPKGYAKCRFGESKDAMLLDSCLLGPTHLSQVESALEDAQNNETWVDVQVRGWGCVQVRKWGFVQGWVIADSLSHQCYECFSTVQPI